MAYRLVAPPQQQPQQAPRYKLVQPPAQSTPWADVNQQSLENVPQSAYENFVEPLTDIPGTLKGAYQLGKGALQHAGQMTGLYEPPEGQPTPEMQVASGVKDQYVKDYSSVEGFKQKASRDPLGVMMDAALPLGILRAPMAASKAARIGRAVPTVAKRDAMAKSGYQAAERSGVTFSAERYEALVNDIGQYVANKGGHPHLTPDTVAVIKDMVKTGGGDMSVKEMQTLRELALAAEGATRAKDRALAKAVKKKIDRFIARDVPEFAEANKNYAMAREGERVEKLIATGERKGKSWWTGAGPENAIRRQFENVNSNDKRMRTFTPPVQKAITNVAEGTKFGNAARWAGKFAPTSPLAVTQGTSAAILGHLMAPGAGAALAPALWAGGAVGRNIAKRGTRNRAEIARALALSGGKLPKVSNPKSVSRVAEALYLSGLEDNRHRNRGQY
jgi:hypothetical protein